jgi:predicted nucleic acid-binding protein
MSGVKAFFDTNVLLYLVSDDREKADKTDQLIEGRGTVSVQVLNEFASVALRKTKLGWPVVHDTLAAVRAACDVVPLSVELHDDGIRIAERYGFPIYDSMIIAAAAISDCDTLYSEDLQDKQVIGQVTIRNPFRPN